MFDWTDTQPSYVIYTDGGANNYGNGGWAYVIVNREDNNKVIEECSGYVSETTSNRMELQAAIEALRSSISMNSMLNVYTDSEYLQKGASIWVNYWIAADWRKKNGKPVENKEMWLHIYKLTRNRAITWHHVRGHSGNKLNNRCHDLVQEAIQSRGRKWKYVKSAVFRRLKLQR